jgi:maleate isomerase
MALSAVVVAHSSSSIAGGEGWDEAVTACLRSRLRPETAVTTNGMDCVNALRHCGVRQPFVIYPPWFGEGTMAAGVAYLAGLGFAVGGSMRHVPEEKWASVPPDALYGEMMHMEQRADLLCNQIVAACPPAADGVLIVGTGLRCVGIIDRLEAALDRPVVTANQASLWICLRLAGIDTPVEGYGRLLAGRRRG